MAGFQVITEAKSETATPGRSGAAVLIENSQGLELSPQGAYSRPSSREKWPQVNVMNVNSEFQALLAETCYGGRGGRDLNEVVCDSPPSSLITLDTLRL